MDALSDVLRLVRLTGAVFLHGELSAPWGLSAPSAAEATTAFMPGAEHLVYYHLVTEGSCVASVAGAGRVPMAAGDVVLLPRGDPHVMASGPEVTPVPALEVFTPPVGLRCGGGGEVTRVVCGFLACDKWPSNPLLDALPSILRVNVRTDPTTAWIEASLGFGACESVAQRSGGATVLAKASELLFVEGVRRFIESLPAEQTGWLAGLRDRFVGRALALLHARPAHAWSVEELARDVGLSRSALADRFATLLGQPPMHYLTRWRLQIAAQKLRTGQGSVAKIAEEVGYESETAFNLVAAILFMVIADLPVSAAAAQPANPPIELIGESSGAPPQPISVCEGPGCATVLSIRYQGEEWVPVAAEDGPGTYVGAAEGINVGTATAPLIVGDVALDKDENVWTITVGFRNGVIQTIPQSFPPLFKRGDWVYVEDGAIRSAQ